MSQEKLGNFLREVSAWRWDEFCRAEHDSSYSSNEAMIFALIRSCAMQQIEAIKMSLNRLDGKLKTPIKIESPKVFYLFPNAQKSEANREKSQLNEAETEVENRNKSEVNREQIVSGEVLPPPEPEPEEASDLPSMSLRQTLAKMADYPREVPEAVTAYALQTEQWMNKQAPEPPEIPMVKSVVAGHLLIMAQKRDIGALTEVFDQIDGKLAETIQLIGEDIYITSFASVAPPEAKPNKDGVLQMEAIQAQNLWAQKLGAIPSA